MRIGDWSSEVCSSDLNRDARDRQRGFADAMANIAGERSPVLLPGDFSEEAGAEAARLLPQGQLPAAAVFAAHDPLGHASCRERLCHDLYISVSAGLLQTKHDNCTDPMNLPRHA